MTVTFTQNWYDLLTKMGYEVSLSGENLLVSSRNANYQMTTYDTESENVCFLVDKQNASDSRYTIFDKDVQCIAIRQHTEQYDMLYIFRHDQISELIRPIVNRMKEQHCFAFSPNTTNEQKLHVRFNQDQNIYEFYMYVPIQWLCSNLKYKQENVSRI